MGAVRAHRAGAHARPPTPADILQSHDTSRFVDFEKTLAFHEEIESRGGSGIENDLGPQELDSSEGEDSGDASAGRDRIRGLPARAEVEPMPLRVSSANPTPSPRAPPLSRSTRLVRRLPWRAIWASRCCTPSSSRRTSSSSSHASRTPRSRRRGFRSGR